jgi:hypothetical protein
MIILLHYSEFNMIVLEADQVARMQRRKDEEREAKECMLVNDIFLFLFGSNDLCCSKYVTPLKLALANSVESLAITSFMSTCDQTGN